MSGKTPITCWPRPIEDWDRPAAHCDHCGAWVTWVDSGCRVCRGGTLPLIVVYATLNPDRRDAFAEYHSLNVNDPDLRAALAEVYGAKP